MRRHSKIEKVKKKKAGSFEFAGHTYFLCQKTTNQQVLQTLYSILEKDAIEKGIRNQEYLLFQPARKNCQNYASAIGKGGGALFAS